jgi:hypothetical protein
MSFSGLSGSTSQFKVKIIGAANNPCVSPSPDIDYNGTIIVTVLSIQESNDDVKIDFSGLVPFPGFETYWSADDIVGNPIFSTSACTWNLMKSSGRCKYTSNWTW